MLHHLYKKTESILGLSFSLAKANFKAKNEGSYLGILWYPLEPLAFFTVLLFLGGAIFNNSIVNYPAYLLLGLIMFNFFLSVTNTSAGMISKNRNFIRSIKIDSITFVVANVFQGVFSHIFEVVLFALLLIYLKIGIVFILFYPLIFICLCLFTAGVSFIFATIGVFVTDWENIWAVGGRLVWFVTPVFYVIKDSNSLIAKLNYINPLSHFITMARNIVVYGQTPTLFSVLGIIGIGICTFLIGFFIFNKNKHSFAERI
jgi:ABC-type polysaccharide/polyol phosphate export permease